MCCQEISTQEMVGPANCGCSCPMTAFMSKKKKIEALKTRRKELEEKVADIKEYIKELESTK